jgi:Na+-translocating ferredoxin:NAD+ oxidoreductase RNF subunit RnfB
MSNKSTLIAVTVATSFIFGMVFGVASYSLAVDSETVRAKCNSVNGHYGGGKCFINGVGIYND